MPDSPKSSPQPPPAATSSPSPSAAEALFHASPLGLLSGTLEAGDHLRIERCNPAFTRLTGFDAQAAVGRGPEALLLRPMASATWRRACQELRLGIPFSDTLRCVRADGSLFWGRVQLHSAPAVSTGQPTWGLSIEDVDLPHEALIRLRQQEEQYRLLAANSRDMILMLRFDGTCTYVSPALGTMLGFDHEHLLNRPYETLFHPEDAELLRHVLGRHLQKQAENLFTHRLRREDGTYVWCETTTRTIWGIEGQQPGSLIAITRDISKRRSAARELQEMHLLLSSVFDSVPLGLCITSSTGRIIQTNQGFARPLGYEPSELCGRIIGNILPSDLLSPGSHTGSCQRASGETFPVSLSATVLSEGLEGNTLITLEDLTQRLTLEARLREAERLESLGTLAGGVAHDFNNLLAIILGYASLLPQAAPGNERVGEYGATIIEAGRRGADVVRQLMLYANQHEPLLSDTDLQTLLANILVHSAEGWPERIRLECDYGARRHRLSIDPDQFTRCIEHLLRNAREAIAGQGTVQLRTAERPPVPGESNHPAGWLEISVVDDGCGMDEATRARMFEPFFSRNKGAEVRGLGLAIVHGIVQAHRGRVEVESSPGRGTRVSILLPLPSEPAAAAAAPQVYPSSNDKAGAGAGILLIEDEPDIGRLWQELLTRQGWTVFWARDGAQALALFELHGERIRIVFSDIGLPGDLNGWELASRFRSARPALPIILASGYFQRGANTRCSISEPVALIDKPYQIPDVLERLNQMLSLAG
jgi:PAS domain S-box-containing protein